MCACILLDRSSGACDKWFGDCDTKVKEVAGTVCGPMLELLAEAIEHPDQDCADFFRCGAQLYGELPTCGLGDAKVRLLITRICLSTYRCTQAEKPDCDKINRDLTVLWQECEESNAELLKCLAEVSANLSKPV